MTHNDLTQKTLLQLAARWQGRTVGLLGGSFNPAHDGHRDIARKALKKLDIDAVWLIVSPGNPLKSNSDMAPLAKRVESALTIAEHPRIFVSDIERQIGTIRSIDTIKALRKLLPKTRFIWLMGADNLATFHHWYDWQGISKHLPIAVFDRPGYSIAALTSRFAVTRHHYKVSPHRITDTQTGDEQRTKSWCFIPMKRNAASATSIRTNAGTGWFRK